jgi:hypothetical protein
LLRLPNSFNPVSPSKWWGQLQTRHQWSPLGENQRPVHKGVSGQCVAYPGRS